VGLTFFDPRLGASREFKVAAPPAVGLGLAKGAGARERAVAAALESALTFLGFVPSIGRDIVVGGRKPGPRSAWLAVEPLHGEAPDAAALAARGFSAPDFDFFLAATHYRRPLAFHWTALAAARDQRLTLEAAARAHAEVAQEPSPRALAGYLHRFRESLSRDLDRPQALDCVRDGLRPGALSPGSRAALLRAALPALGLAGPAHSKP
jgi:hypothetical protein